MGEHGEICALLRAGRSAKETAQKAGCSVPLVYKVASLNGIRMGGQKSILDGKKDEIAKLTAMGESYREIARKYGTTRNTVRSFCKKNGIGLTEEQKSENIKNSHSANTEEDVRRIIQNKHPELEYISGYINNRSRITVLCKKCGMMHEVAFFPMTRDHEHRCPNCIKQKRRAKEEQDAERLRKAEEKRKRRAEEREALRQKRMHNCPVCGTITDRPVYCSNRCRKRAENKRNEINRRTKVKTAMVDRDITLEALYKRDGGLCHICGLKTALDDYVIRDGTHICGDWYPSIDHVVPLAKGGEHSWRNVRLAHRICNSIKADDYAPAS